MILVLRETHDTPAYVARALRLAGGINRFGRPNFRAVWGWNRLCWIGGKWEDRDATGQLLKEAVELRLEPKYWPAERWHIERWCPAEMYGSPAQWYAQTLEVENGRSIPALGPYPQRGEYELAFTLTGPRGEFVQLTPSVAEYVARAIEFSRGLPSLRRRQALDERNRREERDFDAWALEVLDDTCPAPRDSRSPLGFSRGP